MANTGLLILTNPTRITKLLPTIKKHVSKTLYIQYSPEKSVYVSGNYLLAQKKWRGPGHAQTVAKIYTVTSAISSRLDVRILLTSMKNPNLSVIKTKKPVEIVIFDQMYSKKEADTFIQDCLANTTMGCSFIAIHDDKVEEKCDDHAYCESEDKMYKSVVLGGTFDRLHIGHKIFLSEAALRCTEKITVGVTDTNMLSGKLLWELIEPCSTRVTNIKDFLEDVDPSLKYNIVSINDVYGPTKDDANMDMIVVSEETKRGAEKINELRAQRNLNKLDVHVIKLVPDEHRLAHEESKISSCNQRIRLLGTRLRNPTVQDLPITPYIIGLTGGIASGKSSVAEKLQKLGAGLVNCDKVAHNLYLPGKECFKLILQHFGPSILQPDGFINRKALGDIVFSDPEKLDKLNKLVWPVILKESRKEAENLYDKGFNVIVMEAAVLIQAKWQNACHEIWTCIIPPKEAVRRVMDRNQLSEKDANLRIQAQPSNTDQVKEANVVICTLWSYDVTQKQVQTAWDGLSAYLLQIQCK